MERGHINDMDLRAIKNALCSSAIEKCQELLINRRAFSIDDDSLFAVNLRDVFVSPFFVRPKTQDAPSFGAVIQKSEIARQIDAMGRLDRILLEGEAGYGKTTLLNRLALVLAESCDLGSLAREDEIFAERVRENSCGLIDVGRYVGKCPILIRCRDLTVDEHEQDPASLANSILDFISIQVNDEQQNCGRPIGKDDLGITLKKHCSEFVVLIDGLDELNVAAEVFLDAVNRVLPIMEPEHQNSMCIASSRSSAVTYPEGRLPDEIRAFHVITLMRFDEIEADTRFEYMFEIAHAWFSATDTPNTSDHMARAESFVAAIKAGWRLSFRELIRTPFDQALFMVLFSDTEGLPLNRQEACMRYMGARLRWRKGSSPEHLLLKLSYCALKLALNNTIVATKENFTSMLEESYSALNTRIQGAVKRGYRNAHEAAEADLNELVNIHGLLAVSRPRAGLEIVHFEHRMILDYLLANSVVAKLNARLARPADFFRRLYLDTEDRGAGSLDWRPAFSFIAVDRRLQAGDFLELMEAFHDYAVQNPSQVDSISDVLLELLIDGRLSPLDSNLASGIVEVLFESNLRSNQIDALYTLWRSGNSELVFHLLSKYRDACISGSYLYCLQAALFSLFDVLDGSIEQPSLATSQKRTIDLLQRDGMLGLQMLDVAAWFYKENIPLPQDNLITTVVFASLMDDASGEVHSFAYSALLDALLPNNGQLDEGQDGKAVEAMRLFSSLAYYLWIDGLPPAFERTLPELVRCGLNAIKGTLDQVIAENREAPPVRYAIKFLAYLAFFEQKDQSGRDVLNELAESEGLRECLRIEANRLVQSANENQIEAEDDYPQAVLFIANAVGARDVLGIAELEAYLLKQVSSDDETPLASSNIRQSLVKDNRYAHSEGKEQIRARGFAQGETFWCSTNATIGGGKKLARFRVLCAFQDARDFSGTTKYAYGIVFEADNGLLRRSPKANIPLASVLLESGLEGNVYLALYSPSMLGRHEVGKKDALDGVFIKDLEYNEAEVDYYLSVALNQPNLLQIRTRERNSTNPDALPELKFKAVDADGRIIECEALFMFESPETGRNYIVYTDNSIDEEGNTRVYASIYNPEDLRLTAGDDLAALELSPIETDGEWKIIETILEEMQNQVDEPDGQNHLDADAQSSIKAGDHSIFEVFDSPIALFEAGKYTGAINLCIQLVDAHPESIANKTNLAFLIRYCDIDLRDLPADEAFALKSLYTVHSLLEDGVDAGEPFSLLNMALYEYGKGNLRECVNLLSRIGSSDWQILTHSFWHSILWQKMSASEGALVCVLAARYSDCRFEGQAEIEQRAYEEYAPLLDAVEQK